MSKTIVDADGRRWIHRNPPLNRYVITFEEPDKDPYVGLLEDRVARLEARVAELEQSARADDAHVEFSFPSATADLRLDDLPADTCACCGGTAWLSQITLCESCYEDKVA